MDLTLTQTRIESAYSSALTLIAMGETRAETKAALMPDTRLTLGQIDKVLSDALRDALAQGVEREDIDPSWFVRTSA